MKLCFPCVKNLKGKNFERHLKIQAYLNETGAKVFFHSFKNFYEPHKKQALLQPQVRFRKNKTYCEVCKNVLKVENKHINTSKLQKLPY